MPFDATPITSDTIIKLQQMYKLLEKRGGWIQGRMNNERGGYCILGAAMQVGLDVFAADGLLGVVLPDRQSVALFNDDPKRKKKQVLALVQEAIDRQRARLFFGSSPV